MNLQGGRWRATNDGVFDSIIYPLAKAIADRPRFNFVEEGREAEIEVPVFSFYYPILITAGPIYAVSVKDGDTAVREVDWAIVTRELQEDELSGTFTVEVVSCQKLDAYLDVRFFGYLESVSRKLVENARYFDPQWLLKNLGEPKNRRLFDAWVENRSRL